MKYTGDRPIEETRKSSPLSKIRPVFLLGFVVWVAVVAVAIFLIQYEPEPEARGVLSIGAADAPVVVMEFSDFQ